MNVQTAASSRIVSRPRGAANCAEDTACLSAGEREGFPEASPREPLRQQEAFGEHAAFCTPRASLTFQPGVRAVTTHCQQKRKQIERGLVTSRLTPRCRQQRWNLNPAFIRDKPHDP